MSQPKPFLAAEWRHLMMLNYRTTAHLISSFQAAPLPSEGSITTNSTVGPASGRSKRPLPASESPFQSLETPSATLGTAGCTPKLASFPLLIRGQWAARKLTAPLIQRQSVALELSSTRRADPRPNEALSSRHLPEARRKVASGGAGMAWSWATSPSGRAGPALPWAFGPLVSEGAAATRSGLPAPCA